MCYYMVNNAYRNTARNRALGVIAGIGLTFTGAAAGGIIAADLADAHAATLAVAARDAKNDLATTIRDGNQSAILAVDGATGNSVNQMIILNPKQNSTFLASATVQKALNGDLPAAQMRVLETATNGALTNAVNVSNNEWTGYGVEYIFILGAASMFVLGVAASMNTLAKDGAVNKWRLNY